LLISFIALISRKYTQNIPFRAKTNLYARAEACYFISENLFFVFLWHQLPIMDIAFYMGITVRIIEILFFLYLFYIAVKDLYKRTKKRTLAGNMAYITIAISYTVRTIVNLVEFIVSKS
jgi:hypothetical protein